ncbi:MAG: hypothetical protein ACK58T_17705, partial [Phycisphaerae bacterium]
PESDTKRASRSEQQAPPGTRQVAEVSSPSTQTASDCSEAAEAPYPQNEQAARAVVSAIWMEVNG